MYCVHLREVIFITLVPVFSVHVKREYDIFAGEFKSVGKGPLFMEVSPYYNYGFAIVYTYEYCFQSRCKTRSRSPSYCAWSNRTCWRVALISKNCSSCRIWSDSIPMCNNLRRQLRARKIKKHDHPLAIRHYLGMLGQKNRVHIIYTYHSCVIHTS